MSDDSDVDRENKADFTSSTTTTITDVVADEELARHMLWDDLSSSSTVSRRLWNNAVTAKSFQAERVFPTDGLTVTERKK